MANNVNVTNRGFEYICQYLSGTATTSGWTYPTFIGWGGANGYNSASVVLPGSAASSTQGTGQWSDIAPYQEFSETRVAGTPTVIQNTAASGTVGTQIVGTITASTGESVGESFLAFSSSKPTAFTLSSTVSTGASQLTVNTSGALANQYYQLNNEVIKISSTAASNVWNITRAQNGSVANTANTGNIVTFGNVPGAGPSNPSNGDLFAHAGFQALALNTNDSIQFTWVVNITS